MGATNRIVFVLFILLLVIMSANFVLGNVIDQSHRPHLYSLYTPEKVNVFEPFLVKVVIHDRDYRRTVEGVGFGFPDYCGPTFFERIGVTKFSLENMEGEEFEYKFPPRANELEFYVSVLNNGFITTTQDRKLRTCAIHLVHDVEEARRRHNTPDGVGLDLNNYLNFQLEHYPFDFGVKDVPNSFTKLPRDTHSANIFKRNYEKQDGDLSVEIEVNMKNGLEYSYEELVNGEVLFGGVFRTNRPRLSDVVIERYNFELGDGHIGLYCNDIDSFSEYSRENKYYVRCHYYVTVITPVSPVLVDIKFDQTFEYEKEERDHVLNKVDAIKTEIKDLVVSLGDSIYFESDGRNVDFEIEREEIEEERYCGNCGEGYVCNACDECVKEDKAVPPERVEVRADVSIRKSDNKILNAIDQKAIFRVNPNIKFYDGNKRISYCDMQEPGLDVFIRAEITDNITDIYSGFTSGFVIDEREIERIWKLDLARGQESGVFIVAPSNRKKFFSDAQDITQNMSFAIISKDVNIIKKESIVLEPPKRFTIDLNARSDQVHQGSTGVLNVRVSGGTTPRIITKVSLLGPGKIGLSTDTIDTDWILENLGQGDRIRVIYQAPPMGNFDIGTALNSLSMVELQKNAAQEIFKDAVKSYVGNQIKGLGDIADAGRIHQNWGYVGDAYAFYDDALKVIQTPGKMDQIQRNAIQASGGTEGSVEAGWVESGAEWGITGINALQTGVGLLTFFPNRIPYVKEMTTKFDIAFSAATNIWKANFEYIASSERLERAEELHFPAAILVTAQDTSGWTTQEMYIFKIAYHQVN